jgi:ankyrin repeat protein
MKGLFLRAASAAALLLACALPGCKSRQEASSNNLGDAGYQLTAADWFRASADDNPVALELFLKGGMEIGTKTADGSLALHVAAAAGAMKSGKFLLDHKVALDEPGAGGRTPLMEAIVAGKTEMTRWLLKQGADPKAKDAKGFKPLMLAVKEGRSEVIGDLAVYDRDDLDGALLAAALLGQAKVIDELTNYGGSIYARMDDGRTALMVAAENGHAEAVKLLIEIGSNRFTTDPEGHTAADLAAEAGHAEIVALLSAEPTQGELALQSDQQIGTEMAASLDSPRAGTTNAIPEGTDDPVAATPGKAPAKQAPESIDGVDLTGAVTTSADVPGVREPLAVPGGREATPPAVAKPVGLVMRSYRQRELPVEITHVEGGNAQVKLRGTKPREVSVAQGGTIPGSRLQIVGLRRKMHSGKENLGKLTEVSVVEVEDSATGVRRELIAGVPASAHDPVALVEDQSTGRRFMASPGQHFTASDGTRYIVADVRPNQIVLENEATKVTQTLPLRGPRG